MDRMESVGGAIAPVGAPPQCEHCGTMKLDSRRYGRCYLPGDKPVCGKCFTRYCRGEPVRVMTKHWCGTHASRYSNWKPKRWDCWIRGGDGALRRYMVVHDDGHNPGYLVCVRDFTADSDEGASLYPPGDDAKLVCGSDARDAWTSKDKGMGACEKHLHRWQMVAPLTFLEVDGRGRPLDETAAAVFDAAARRREAA